MTPTHCTAPGCTKPHRARGLCVTCYNRQVRSGLMQTGERRPPNAGKTCSFDGCDCPSKGLGLCRGHYNQQWRGMPLTPLVGPLEVHAYFVYARPASHYGTGRNAHQLKPSAPAMKHTAPDLDKLQRALGDALTQAGTIRDDARIVVWHAVKRWADIPHTYLTIRHVGAPE